MTAYHQLRQELSAEPRKWLITGVAGFIGSHILETLLSLDQTVVGLDSLTTGSPRNIDAVKGRVSPDQWKRFTFQEGSVADMSACRTASNRVDYVLHHAGFVSVPLSIEDPLACHATNVTGTLNLLIAARDNRVRRVIYASSSAVYGDNERQPQVEEEIGKPLSPYGGSKLMNELYARLFFENHGLESIGLRYFNIFGARQNPTGGYAAVIPHWISTILKGERCVAYGDGENTRDFCPVADVVQANLLAATTRNRHALGEVFNVALGSSMTLNQLHELLAKVAGAAGKEVLALEHGPSRAGDIRHSSADIRKAREQLGFTPSSSLLESLEETFRFYLDRA